MVCAMPDDVASHYALSAVARTGSHHAVYGEHALSLIRHPQSHAQVRITPFTLSMRSLSSVIRGRTHRFASHRLR